MDLTIGFQLSSVEETEIAFTRPLGDVTTSFLHVNACLGEEYEPTTIRLSVGIEPAEQIINAMEKALASIYHQKSRLDIAFILPVVPTGDLSRLPPNSSSSHKLFNSGYCAIDVCKRVVDRWT